MNPARSGSSAPATQPRGISLLEVMIATMILMVAATALVVATMSAMHKTRLSDELRAASFAARQKMEELLHDDILTIKSKVAADDTFAVYLNGSDDKVSAHKIELPGIGGANAAEIILVDTEDKTAAGLGVTLCPLPMDFNGNGTTNDASPIQANKLLIGVVVRWITANGREERYELWSVK
jgi:type II secretory pathway pseudopilin PulG